MVTHLHLGFKIEDYERWKQGYDESAEHRKETGEVSYKVFRNAEDPNTVSVLSVYETAEQIQSWIDSPELHDKMKKAGITEMGQMIMLEETASGTHE